MTNEELEKAFENWWSRKSRTLDLNRDTIENLYSVPMIETLSHVFAAGWFYRHGTMQGCWVKYVEFQKRCPDYFHGYCYRTKEGYSSSLRALFAAGASSK